MPDETKNDPRRSTPSPDAALAKPPDGGSLAWLHAFLCHMVFFNTWGVTNSFGIFQQYYTKTLGRGPSDVAWIGGIQMCLIFFGGALSGRASDAGYFRHCFYAGVAVQVVGMLLASWATEYYQILLAQGFCVGIGNGLIFTPGLSVTSSYFSTRRSVALGISAAGAGTGGMVYPAIVHSLLGSIGHGWTMRVVALVMLCTHIPALVGYRPRLPPRRRGPLIDWQAFRQGPFVFFTAAMFLHMWGLYMAFFYLGTYAREVVRVDNSFSLIIVLNGVGVVGRVLPNFLGQHYTGVLNMAIIFSVVCGACIYSWPAIRDVAGLYAWAVVYGIFAGGMQSVLPTLATGLAPEPDRVGTWAGMSLSVVSFSVLTAASIQGGLIQADGGRYLGAEMFSASVVVVGCIFLLLNRWCKVGTELLVKV